MFLLTRDAVVDQRYVITNRVVEYDQDRLPSSDRWVGGVVAGLACLSVLKARGHPRSAAVFTAACAIVLGAFGFLLIPLLLAPLMVAL